MSTGTINGARRAWAALAAVALMGAAVQASGPPAGAERALRSEPGPWLEGVSEAARAAAHASFLEGIALYHDGLFPQAAHRFRQALGGWDHPAIRFNLGKTLINLEQEPAALEQLWGAMRFGGAPLQPEHILQVERYSALLWTSEVAHLVLRSEASGIVVTVDGARALDGPGTWEGLVRSGADVRIEASRGDGAPITLVRAFDAQTRTEVIFPAPSRGLAPPSVTTRAATDTDLRSLQRRLVGFEVRWPTADERAAWARPAAKHRPEGARPTLPDPELSEEATRICRGARGDLAVVCAEATAARRGLAELARRVEAHRRDAEATRAEAQRRLEELAARGLVLALD